MAINYLVDGFEDGNYDEWTVVDDAGGSIAVQSSVVKSGSYALQMATNGNNNDANITLSRKIQGDLVDGMEFSAWVRVSALGWYQQGTLWLYDSASGAWVLIEFWGNGGIVYNGNNIPATTLVSSASPDTWYKFVITWHSNSVDFRVEDESGNVLGEATGINAATSYEFDEVRLRTQDDSNSTGSYSAYFDDIVYGRLPLFSLQVVQLQVTKRPWVGRHPNNPLITSDSWGWIHSYIREDGKCYDYFGIGNSSTTYRSLLLKSNHHVDYDEYGAVTSTPIQIMKVVHIDGVKYLIAWHQNTGARLFYAETPHELNDYGIVYDPTVTGFADQVLHPHFLVADGIYYHDCINQDNNHGYLLFGEYIHETPNFYGDIMSAQATWEHGQITNMHIFVIDGEYKIYYSAGASGRNRDIGVRWAKYYSDFNLNLRDSPTLVAGVQSWEDDYINIGEFDFELLMLLYFGFGTGDTGVYNFEYHDLKQPEYTQYCIYADANGVLQG